MDNQKLTPDGLHIFELPVVGFAVSAAEHCFKLSEWQSEKRQLEEEIARIKSSSVRERSYWGPG